MSMMKSLGLAGPAILAASLALGQETPKANDKGPESVEGINAEYERGVQALERQRLVRLAGLADRQKGPEAEETYEAIFRLAIAHDLYKEAEPIAEKVLRAGTAAAPVNTLAVLVRVIAQADRGAFDDSLNSLVAAMRAAGKAREEGQPTTAVPLPEAARVSLVEAYFQRLVYAGRYDVARRAMGVIRDNAQSPAVRRLADNRLARVELVGRPAPQLSGTDFDGKKIRVVDFRGKVILVVFWATWCVPSAQEARWLGQAYEDYRARGFGILGVNLDAADEGGREAREVLPAIRRFLLDYNVRWPNILNGSGDEDVARAYRVVDIPASYLIDRDGTVIGLDVTRADFARVIDEALGR